MEHIKDIFLTIMWDKYKQAMAQGRLADAISWLNMAEEIIDN